MALYKLAVCKAGAGDPDFIEDLRHAIALDPSLRVDARTESNFDRVRDAPEFQELVG